MSHFVSQLSRFGAVGAVGTGAHYALFLALIHTADADPVAASAAGATLGACVNYVLNYRYTFRSARRHREALPRFFAVAAAGLLLNTTLMAILIDGLGVHYLIAQIVTTLGVLLWNFLANRHWTFGKDAT